MNWTHAAVAVLFAAAFYYLGSKYPGMLSKMTAGTISA